ncbi:MAG: hypothetical protein FWE67_08200 [Planctomycetaceae bacterium]|nr:hypothetical protein [Planctomycetaceae bacterium]
MDIIGTITGIPYKPLLCKPLKEINFADFDVNAAPSACLVKDGRFQFAISKWVSPKRTRPYPFERIYDTLNIAAKITIIPIVKDEGIDGDRDYIQWDTVSLMSLLNVFVICAYYDSAVVNSRNTDKKKITKQRFDNSYIVGKIEEIKKYHSSALHWNLNELQNIHSVISKVKSAYKKIEKQTCIPLHNAEGIDVFAQQIGQDVSTFMQFSRGKSEKAQAREIVTVQPKEHLQTQTKAKITITNYLGGQYFLTADEACYKDGTLTLIESKHTKSGWIPSVGDIKDGLLKMILFSNLTNVKINGLPTRLCPMVRLTSPRIKKSIAVCRNLDEAELHQFIQNSAIPARYQKIIRLLFNEALQNKFSLIIEGSQ